MAFQKFEFEFPSLTAEELATWRTIPPAVASDCMNRTQSMSSAIKPISEGLILCGQARTVTTMVGDCGPVSALISAARAGEVIVVDAGGAEDVAVWGGVMGEEAIHRKLGGAVVDGAVRDIAELRRSGLVMFCRSIVPRGPHHGFGGIIDGTVSVAGISVSPGDIVLGNDDGVVVVPLRQAAEVLAASQTQILKEQKWLDGIHRGETIPDMFLMPRLELFGTRK